MERALRDGIVAKQPQSAWIVSHADLARLLTWGSLAVEFAGPLLVLTPFPRLRGAGAVLMMQFHIATGFFIELGYFPLYCIALFLPLLPSTWLPLPATRSTESHEVRPAQPVQRGRLTRCLRFFAAVLPFMFGAYASLSEVPHHSDHLIFQAGRFFSFDQVWNMYTEPLWQTHWMTMAGLMEDKRATVLQFGGPSGNTVDVLEGKLNLTEPAAYHATFRSQHWRLLVYNWFSYGFLNQHVGAYVCKVANRNLPPGARVVVVQYVRISKLLGSEYKHVYGGRDWAATNWFYDCKTNKMWKGNL